MSDARDGWVQAVRITEECYSINDMMADDGGARDPADLIQWSDDLVPYDPQEGLSMDYAGQFIAIWLRWKKPSGPAQILNI